VALGHDASLEILNEIHFPHSLGLLYSAFTYYTGFKVNSGEYKLMGLAPYGEPKFADLILENLIDVKADGSFRLNMDYFDYCTGLTMTNERFDRLFGGPPRGAEALLTQREMDLAASVQAVTEQVIVKMGRSIASETKERNLCLAGGVALNCVANGKLLRDGCFDDIWVQPAAGDAGGALGAALSAYHLFKKQPRVLPASGDSMAGSYLGPEFSQVDIEARLQAAGARFRVVDQAGLLDECAAALGDSKALGWFQGRMEFGPRALGARSILGDARSPQMQSVLNLKIKYRESFRPFAPAVLAEDVSEWFEIDRPSPYMLMVADIQKSHRRLPTPAENELFGIEKLKVPRSDIPAVTHVDYSARVQTVHRETNLLFYGLIAQFKQQTGCPVIVNTSFNIRGEPIVHTPEDAFRCFMGSDIDVLAIGLCVLRKEDQDPALRIDYRDAVADD
jgi:carbamoyltransferase